ncbi:MAG: hypothetical protein ACYC7D_00815 [Nitrososphaerales archaeon]
MEFRTKTSMIITTSLIIALLTLGVIVFASGSPFRSYGAVTSVTVTASSSYDKWIYVSGTISPAWETSAQVTISVHNPNGVQVLTGSAAISPGTSTVSENFTVGTKGWVNGTYSAIVAWVNSTTSSSGSGSFAYGTSSTATSSLTTTSTSTSKATSSSSSKATTTIFVNRSTTVTSATTIRSVTTSITTSVTTSITTEATTEITTAPGQVTTITSTVNEPGSTVSSVITTTLVRPDGTGLTLAAVGVGIAIVASTVSVVALRKQRNTV